MTDENMKAALTAALTHIPDGYWTVLLCGPIPEFGKQAAPGNVEICTTTTSEIVDEIIVRMGKAIEARKPKPLSDPGRN